MISLSESQKDTMGQLNNFIVDVLQKSALTIPEAIMVLRKIIDDLDRLFGEFVAKEKV